LRDLKITVGDVEPNGLGEEIQTATAVCTHQSGVLPDSEYAFVCDTPVVGRFLNIQSVPGSDILTLCEVEVFAHPGALCLDSPWFPFMICFVFNARNNDGTII
jgi:hypothetical protein